MNIIKSENSEICRKKGWDKLNISEIWLLFTEEIGELAAAIRHRRNLFSNQSSRKDNVKNEMGDVFSYLLQLSDVLNVDLDDMWIEHKKKMYSKHY